MAPRRRKPENSDMPTGLTAVTHRGAIRFRYRYPSGKQVWFPIETKRHEAVEAAAIFNAEHRNPSVKLMEESDRYNRTINHWLPKVIKRVKADENLSNQVMKTFLSRCDKLMQSHGDVYSKAISLETVNEFMEIHGEGKSNEVKNKLISFLRKIFGYMVDMSAMEKNVALDKKLRPVAKKMRKRLKLEDYQAIYNAAPHYLQTAMELALQTTHAVLEVSRIKYNHCTMLSTPEIIDGVKIYGYMRIHRQKVKKKESSRVEIPITKALFEIIETSRQDRVLSPYLVHRISEGTNALPKECDHPTQVTTEYISKSFSRVRDELGLFNGMDMKYRPTFHEIRALSIHLFTEMGYDPQARAAHADAKSTKVYQQNHVEWVRVPAGEIAKC